jgi:hypothetical protein
MSSRSYYPCLIFEFHRTQDETHDRYLTHTGSQRDPMPDIESYRIPEVYHARYPKTTGFQKGPFANYLNSISYHLMPDT